MAKQHLTELEVYQKAIHHIPPRVRATMGTFIRNRIQIALQQVKDFGFDEYMERHFHATDSRQADVVSLIPHCNLDHVQRHVCDVKRELISCHEIFRVIAQHYTE